jgi:hypothetical protein
MKYLCIVYNDEDKLRAMSASEFESFSDEHVALDEELKKSGHSIVAEALQPAHTATTVRIRNGKLSTTDGPFAETKEQLGGIYLIEAGDMEEAIQVAARIPSAQIGSIEVRPVWELRRQAMICDRSRRYPSRRSSHSPQPSRCESRPATDSKTA